jgi:hypothetical protein
VSRRRIVSVPRAAVEKVIADLEAALLSADASVKAPRGGHAYALGGLQANVEFAIDRLRVELGQDPPRREP